MTINDRLSHRAKTARPTRPDQPREPTNLDYRYGDDRHRGRRGRGALRRRSASARPMRRRAPQIDQRFIEVAI